MPTVIRTAIFARMFLAVFSHFRLNQNENGEIEVEDFLRFIDSCKNTSAASVPKNFFVSIDVISVR